MKFKKIKNSVKNSVGSYTANWAKRAPKKRAGVIGYTMLLELLVLIPEVVIMLPLLIISYCYAANQFGMSIGDADGAFSGFGYLLTVTALVTLLIIIVFQTLIAMTIKKAWKNTRKVKSEK